MCTNRALVDSLECYMDDLVDCFEDFVKKSLILISVGVATVVAMFVYMLKVLKDRPETLSTAVTNDQNLRRCNSNTSIPSTASKSSSKRNNRSDYVIAYDPNKIGSSTNHHMLPSPSDDERLLREFGYMNYNRSCELKPRILPSIAPHSRISIPSLPSCYTKQHLPSLRNCVKVLKRTSCCSLCCDDNKSNISHI